MLYFLYVSDPISSFFHVLCLYWHLMLRAFMCKRIRQLYPAAVAVWGRKGVKKRRGSSTPPPCIAPLPNRITHAPHCCQITFEKNFPLLRGAKNMSRFLQAAFRLHLGLFYSAPPPLFFPTLPVSFSSRLFCVFERSLIASWKLNFFLLRSYIFQSFRKRKMEDWNLILDPKK